MSDPRRQWPTVDQYFAALFVGGVKPKIPRYFECALRLTRPGSVIVVDNVIAPASRS